MASGRHATDGRSGTGGALLRGVRAALIVTAVVWWGAGMPLAWRRGRRARGARLDAVAVGGPIGSRFS